MEEEIKEKEAEREERENIGKRVDTRDSRECNV